MYEQIPRIKKGKWDMGTDYSTLKNMIIEQVKEVLEGELKKEYRKIPYLIIYAIELRNGSRISEALRSYMEWREDFKTGTQLRNYVEIAVSKKRRPEKRFMFLPSWIPEQAYQVAFKQKIKITKAKAIVYCRRLLGVNAHTLRYAGITHLLEITKDPILVSKMTKHSKADFMITYMQEIRAIERLKQIE